MKSIMWKAFLVCTAALLVTLSTRDSRSQEAGVKYFFLGAMGAAVWLVPAPCDYRHQDGHSHPWARDDAVRPDFARL